MSRSTSRLLVSITCAASVSYVCAQEPAVEPALTQAIVLQALETNPEIQGQWQAFIAAEYDVGTARAGYLPSLDLTASTGRQARDFDGRGSYEINQAQISLTQMLFDGFAVSGEVDRLDSARQVRFFELLNAVDTIALESIRAAEDVVRFRTLLELAQANYREHLEVQRQIDERVSQGVGRRADLDQVDGRVALAESNLLTEAANLHDVTARYLRIVGDLPSQALVPSNLRAEQLPAPIQDILYAAYTGNPEFHAAIKNIAAAEGAVKRERSGYMPRLELRARHGTQQNLGVYDERFDPEDFGDDTVVELALTYNLFNGGGNRAAVKRSLAQVSQAKYQRDQACTNLRQEVQVAYNDTQRIQEQLISLNRHRDSIDKVRRAYAEQFQIGQRTLLDLLDAENEYFQASRSLVNAEHDLTIAHTSILSLTGRLLPALQLTREQLTSLRDTDDELGDIQVEPSAACPAISPAPLTRDDLVTEVITLEVDALFAGQSSQLSHEAMTDLAGLLQQWQRSGGLAEVDILAYNGTASSTSLNESLARARAQAVKNYLMINGLEAARVNADGYSLSAENASEFSGIESRVEITLRKFSS